MGLWPLYHCKAHRSVYSAEEAFMTDVFSLQGDPVLHQIFLTDWEPADKLQ